MCVRLCACVCVCGTHSCKSAPVCAVGSGGGRKWGWKKIRVGVSDPEINVCGPDRRTDRGAGPSLSLTADQDFQN